MTKTRASLAALALGLATAALAGCGSDSDGTGAETSTSTAATGEPIVVVASTNVWGDIAEQVGGDAVEVTSIISSPDQDPHSFEASASNALILTKAQLVIENGGGYDDFMDQLLDAHDSSATVLNAVDISGKTAPEDGELNEHVWYDLPTAEKVADEIAAQLGTLAPDEADTFTANASTFKSMVDQVVSAEADLKSKYDGEAIGITEPVPLYLTEAAGLVNKTPEEFSEAIEEGDDVSAAVLKETLDLYTNKEVAALVYNEQTSGPITEKVEKAASDAGIPVVPVTETLPDGLDYVGWMQQNVDALGAALAK
ncbi:metal ABC transporter solute-binding protein, Zn/Mn family [Nocardioides sp.]|uniref:metal ABC transporter solute-binding protein, Zn/Mn family n=1 Tax=Nocardioides sp. TaxID=35761 RepID=UPI0039E5C31F